MIFLLSQTTRKVLRQPLKASFGVVIVILVAVVGVIIYWQPTEPGFYHRQALLLRYASKIAELMDRDGSLQIDELRRAADDINSNISGRRFIIREVTGMSNGAFGLLAISDNNGQKSVVVMDIRGRSAFSVGRDGRNGISWESATEFVNRADSRRIELHWL